MLLQKLRTWYTRKSPVELWLDLLGTAEAFEDWEEAALHLDNLLGLDLWHVYSRYSPLIKRTQLTPSQEKQPSFQIL
jgi:hypothetical protein